MKLGFCGLGLMGVPMVSRLLDAGHDVTVWNRTASRAQPARDAGARIAATPAQLADECESVILCLFDWRAVESVVFGDQGLVHGQAIRHITDHSTLPVDKTLEFAQRAREHAVAWTDAPVSGGVAGVENGSLAIMAGGDANDLAAIQPALMAYAQRVTRMGDVGAGQATKLCNQTIVSATVAAIAEAVTLARNSGVEAALLNEALAGGWADSVLLQTFVPRMTADPAPATATIRVMLKDLDTIAALSREQMTPMPVSSATRQLYCLANAAGLGEEDIAQLVRVLKPS